MTNQLVIVFAELAKPTNIKVTSASHTSLNVSWDNADGNFDNYNVTCIQQQTNDSTEDDTGNSDSTNFNISSYTCIGLTPGGLYLVRVVTEKSDFEMVDCKTECEVMEVTGKYNVNVVEEPSL